MPILKVFLVSGEMLHFVLSNYRSVQRKRDNVGFVYKSEARLSELKLGEIMFLYFCIIFSCHTNCRVALYYGVWL